MPKKKKPGVDDVKITKDDAGNEIYRLRGKVTKQYKVERYLRALHLSKFRKKQEKNHPDSEKVDIPVDGERITNLRCMAEQMFCGHCREKLSLSDIVGEVCEGLGSIFDMKCPKCLFVTKVNSSEKYVNKSTNRKLFTINSKLALGKYFTCIVKPV